MADRRFANSHILQIFEDLKFDYGLRIRENLIVKKSREILKIYKIMPSKTYLFCRGRILGKGCNNCGQDVK
jgi:hypothetical protein